MLGCIISSNSNTNILDSNLSGTSGITPVVGIKNSKIFWNNPSQANISEPHILGNQDSFINFPSCYNNSELLGSLYGNIKVTHFDKSISYLKDEKGYNRLINNGTTFLWDSTNIIYPSNIESYELTISSDIDFESLSYLQKNLHGRTLTLNLTNNTILNGEINGFYNGIINVNINDSIDIDIIKFINIDYLIINGNSNTLNAINNNKSILYFENVKHLEINNTIFDAKQTNITSNYNNKPQLPNYILNLYTYYQNNLWKSCIELKSVNAIIHNCSFSNSYCSIICSVNSLVTGYQNTFNINSFTIDDIPFRMIGYLSTHNSIVNDGSSMCLFNNNNSIPLSGITLNNEQYDKTLSMIPIAVMPGSFGNHYHKPLIASNDDIYNASNMSNCLPVGAIVATINAINLKYPTETNQYVWSNSDDILAYGFHYYNNNIKLGNFMNYTTNAFYEIVNDTLDNVAVSYNTSAPVIPNVNVNDISIRSYENLSLFDAIRFNFNLSSYLNNLSEIATSADLNYYFTIPKNIYGNLFSGDNIKITVKDCFYNYFNKNIAYELIKENTTFPAYNTNNIINRSN